MLLKENASDEWINLWLKGGLSCLGMIENELEIIERKKLWELKLKIDKYKEHLKKEFSLVSEISDAIGVLIETEQFHPLIKAWVKSVEDILFQIEKQIKFIEEDSNIN